MPSGNPNMGKNTLSSTKSTNFSSGKPGTGSGGNSNPGQRSATNPGGSTGLGQPSGGSRSNVSAGGAGTGRGGNANPGERSASNPAGSTGLGQPSGGNRTTGGNANSGGIRSNPGERTGSNPGGTLGLGGPSQRSGGGAHPGHLNVSRGLSPTQRAIDPTRTGLSPVRPNPGERSLTNPGGTLGLGRPSLSLPDAPGGFAPRVGTITGLDEGQDGPLGFGMPEREVNPNTWDQILGEQLARERLARQLDEWGFAYEPEREPRTWRDYYTDPDLDYSYDQDRFMEMPDVNDPSLLQQAKLQDRYTFDDAFPEEARQGTTYSGPKGVPRLGLNDGAWVAAGGIAPPDFGITDPEERAKIMSDLPRGIRNNNPGNLQTPSWAHEVPGVVGLESMGKKSRFMTFTRPEYGIMAMDTWLDKNPRRNTPYSIVDKYAPAFENNVGAYAGRIAKDLGIGINDQIPGDPDTRARVIDSMIAHENYRNPYGIGGVRLALGMDKVAPGGMDIAEGEPAPNRQERGDRLSPSPAAETGRYSPEQTLGNFRGTASRAPPSGTVASGYASPDQIRDLGAVARDDMPDSFNPRSYSDNIIGHLEQERAARIADEIGGVVPAISPRERYSFGPDDVGFQPDDPVGFAEKVLGAPEAYPGRSRINPTTFNEPKRISSIYDEPTRARRTFDEPERTSIYDEAERSFGVYDEPRRIISTFDEPTRNLGRRLIDQQINARLQKQARDALTFKHQLQERRFSPPIDQFPGRSRMVPSREVMPTVRAFPEVPVGRNIFNHRPDIRAFPDVEVSDNTFRPRPDVRAFPEVPVGDNRFPYSPMVRAFPEVAIGDNRFAYRPTMPEPGEIPVGDNTLNFRPDIRAFPEVPVSDNTFPGGFTPSVNPNAPWEHAPIDPEMDNSVPDDGEPVPVGEDIEKKVQEAFRKYPDFLVRKELQKQGITITPDGRVRATFGVTPDLDAALDGLENMPTPKQPEKPKQTQAPAEPHPPSSKVAAKPKVEKDQSRITPDDSFEPEPAPKKSVTKDQERVPQDPDFEPETTQTPAPPAPKKTVPAPPVPEKQKEPARLPRRPFTPTPTRKVVAARVGTSSERRSDGNVAQERRERRKFLQNQRPKPPGPVAPAPELPYTVTPPAQFPESQAEIYWRLMGPQILANILNGVPFDA